jgi:hypothetical protein
MKRFTWRWLGFALIILALTLPTMKLFALGEFSWAGGILGLLVAAVILLAFAQAVRARARRARVRYPDAYVCSVSIYPELIWEVQAAYPEAPRFLAGRAATVVIDERGMRILVGLGLRQIVAIPASDVRTVNTETTTQGPWNLATAAFHIVTHQGSFTVHLTLSRWSFAFARVIKGAALEAELVSVRSHLGEISEANR